MLVAMSGGVDSSVAAALMVRRGLEAVGVTLQIWQESQTDPRHAGCCSLGAVEDARRVARQLGIAHYVLNFREEFRESVIRGFLDEYEAGRTPNPCVECNRTVKFEMLAAKAREMGCSGLVTGHYARIRRDAAGRHRLLRARGSEKDQSYVLYMLTQEQLAMSRFPMGEFASKREARKLAREMGLHLHDKPDSQEICFVSEAGGYREFLKKARPDSQRQGDVVDDRGELVGAHSGIANFTVGQRRGVGVASRTGTPLYVLKVEPETNRVVVGERDLLLRREVLVREVIWGRISASDLPARVTAKIRYNMAPQKATLVPASGVGLRASGGGRRPSGSDGAVLVFDEPVRAVTPGQIAVAYRGQSVAMGGVISIDD